MKFDNLFRCDSTSASHDLRQALNFGTTMTTRFWIALFSLTTGAQIFAGRGSVLHDSTIGGLALQYWAVALLVAGGLMLWRAISPKRRQLWGWISNGANLLVWAAIVISRVIAEGASGVLGTSTVILIMTAWCHIRTEATLTDRETM